MKVAGVGENMSFIFVVEDEFDIQELLKNYMEEAGYQVLCASDGVEAINLYEKEKEKIDLVLLDVMLPKIDGFGVLTRNQLLDAVWGTDYFGEDRIVDTYIKNLRKKLTGDYIDTRFSGTDIRCKSEKTGRIFIWLYTGKRYVSYKRI